MSAAATEALPKKLSVPAFSSHVASNRRICDRWDNTNQGVKFYEGRVIVAPRVGAFLDIGEGIIKGSWAVLASIVTTVVFRNFRHAYYKAVADQFSSAFWSFKVVLKPNWTLNKLYYTHKFPDKSWGRPFENKERRMVQGSYYKTPYGTVYVPNKSTWKSKCGVVGNVLFTTEKV